MSPIEIAPICAPGMPGISNIGMPPEDCVSISISLSLSSPARSFLRKESRVAGLDAGADQRIQHALLGGELRAGLHVLALALADLHDRDLDEVADDLLDVAADIADLGELGGLDLDEGRAGELRQPPRDLGLADAGRPDHQDVFRQHLFAQLPVSCSRRQRLRSAIATARLASAWPTMKRSSSETISRGEKSVMCPS